MYPSHTPPTEPIARSFDQSRALEISAAYKENRVLLESRNMWRGCAFVALFCFVPTMLGFLALTDANARLTHACGLPPPAPVTSLKPCAWDYGPSISATPPLPVVDRLIDHVRPW